MKFHLEHIYDKQPAIQSFQFKEIGPLSGIAATAVRFRNGNQPGIYFIDGNYKRVFANDLHGILMIFNPIPTNFEENRYYNGPL